MCNHNALGQVLHNQHKSNNIWGSNGAYSNGNSVADRNGNSASCPHGVAAAPQDAFQGRPSDGVIALQIDGLGYRQLLEAVAQGKAPRMQEMLKDGFQLQHYKSGIPAETIPVLSSMFYGVRLPANDWWDKSERKMVDSLDKEDEIRQKALALNNEPGFTAGGQAFLAPISGGADKGNLVASMIQKTAHSLGKFRAFARETWTTTGLLVRSNTPLLKTAYNTIKDLLSARRYLKNEGQHNTGWDKAYPVMLTLAHNVFPQAASQGVQETIEQGGKVAYVDFTDYDEWGHYYGCKSPQALDAITNIDREIGEIRDKIRSSGKNYQLLVFSDHGQTNSKPFQQVFGQSLEEVIDAQCNQTRKADGKAPLQSDEIATAHCYSMNNIYFNNFPGAVEEKQIEKAYPGLLNSLVEHPGVGMVVSRTSDGLVLRGKDGTLTVSGDKVDLQGQNPLGQYAVELPNLKGERVRPDESELLQQIRDYAKIEQTGDVMVFAIYNQKDDSTYDFGLKYSLKSLHGGIGGDQGVPFLLSAPGQLDATGVLSALDLHDKLHEMKCRV